MGWREAIIAVLEERDEPMHYVEIADAIMTAGLKIDVGATPPASVNALLSTSLKNGEQTFERVSRGVYRLRDGSTTKFPAESVPDDDDTSSTDAGLVNAFGMYWRRDQVVWSPPALLGQQSTGAEPVDFAEQRGVYLLHDRRDVVYVGRSMKRGFGQRLLEHTVDRLNGRWDRFSWFGVHPVHEDGSLGNDDDLDFSVDLLIATMEALLIEGLEPPQNRKRGDDFRAVEFLQAENPELAKKRVAAMLDDLKRSI